MGKRLAIDQVERLLIQTMASLRHEECSTCECLQGFITQLELDAADALAVAEITRPWKVSRTDMHACLGCDPCPPGSAFADHIKARKNAATTCANTKKTTSTQSS